MEDEEEGWAIVAWGRLRVFWLASPSNPNDWVRAIHHGSILSGIIMPRAIAGLDTETTQTFYATIL